MMMHYHTCTACAETIGGTEADTRAHLAHQIGAAVDPDPEQWRIICHCGWPMAVQWVNECDECKEEYEPNGDGYNGLCPHCADGADAATSSDTPLTMDALRTHQQRILNTKTGDFTPIFPPLVQQRARETATILAALRMWQAEAVGVRDELPYDDIATNDGAFPAMDSAEIDALCERLNQ